VRRDGALVPLRPRVFDLLLALARHHGVAISRQALLREVWAREDGCGERTVDMHVAHLRRQLGDDAESPRLVVTVRKLGYRLEA
jgi:two-component system alkaline phosphatase synthesis response regulator PhoP